MGQDLAAAELNLLRYLTFLETGVKCVQSFAALFRLLLIRTFLKYYKKKKKKPPDFSFYLTEFYN